MASLYHVFKLIFIFEIVFLFEAVFILLDVHLFSVPYGKISSAYMIKKLGNVLRNHVRGASGGQGLLDNKDCALKGRGDSALK